MATEKKKVDPTQAARAGQAPAILNDPLPKKLEELLADATEKDLRGPETNAETLKGNTATPGVWVHSPSVFKLSALATQRLVKVARWAGLGDTRVTRVHARLIGGSNTVLIKAADPMDLTAYELSYYPGVSGGIINLYTLLGPARCTVQTGYRQRYDVHLVPKGSPLWPGLVIDMDDPKDRKPEPSRKKKSST